MVTQIESHPLCSDALRRMDALVIGDALLDQLSSLCGKFEAALNMLQNVLVKIERQKFNSKNLYLRGGW